MEFKTLAELVRYLDNAFALKFYSGAGVLRKGVLKVLASVIGGAVYMLSLLAKRIWKNRFVSTCDISALDGFGAEYGIPHKPATFAYGYLAVSFASGTSATVPADTYFVDSVTGKQYKTVASATVTASSPNVRVIAAEAGADSCLDVGTELQFRDSTPTGLNDAVTVVADADNNGIAYGYSVDVEIDGETQQWGESADEYRQRLLNRIQNPPQGGSANDYRQNAERFTSVSKAYVKCNDPLPNDVLVALANWNSDGIAVASADVSEVYDYISSDVRRPITANVRVISVTPVTFAITAAISPFNEEMKSKIQNAFDSLARDIEPGNIWSISQVEGYIKGNSDSAKFSIGTAYKAGAEVAEIETVFDGTTNLAEVAKFELTFKQA